MFSSSVILLVLILLVCYKIYRHTQSLQQELAQLKEELRHEFNQTRKALLDLQQEEIIPNTNQESEVTIPPHEVIIEPIISKPQEEVISEPIIIQPEEPEKIEVAEEKLEIETQAIPNEPTPSSEQKMYEPIPGNSMPKAAFNKTNLEQFIGEKLISIIGIAILVLGVFFTVKWAVDKNLISDAGKVLIGLAAGGILIGFAHKLATSYRAFSSILVGGAIAIFYFSIYQSFQAYHLLNQTTAFIGMIGITGLAVFLSTIYNRIELAMIALIGGFLTPFFVSTGSGNFVVLFSYMLILNLGLFLLAYSKKWPLVYWSAYVLTLVIYGAWLLKEYQPQIHPTLTAFTFALLFHITFLATALVYKLRKQERFEVPEISLLLSNAFAFLLAGLFLLNKFHDGKFQGLFVLLLAALYLGISLWLYRKQGIDKNLLFLLIALVCTFISLAGPIQLDGNAISLFWAAEGVVLLYVGQKSKLAFIKQASAVVLVLTLIRLSMDWQETYYTVRIYTLTPVFNKGFLTALVVMSSCYLQGRLLLQEQDSHWFYNSLPLSFWKNTLHVIFSLLLFFSIFFELGYQAMVFSGESAFRHIMQGTWLLIYASIVFKQFNRKHHLLSLPAQLALLFLFLGYLFYEGNIDNLQVFYLTNNLKGIYYHVHYALPIAALVFCGLLVKYILSIPDRKSTSFLLLSTGTFIAAVYILSMESLHLWVQTTYKSGLFTGELERKAIKTAWPILWSVFSLGTMILGMKLRIKLWRLLSLGLFTLTIIKLFTYDISNVGQGGKIAAFIILGIVLLLVSFLYQKIKGLFTDDQD